jgi:hypothetical protein
MVVFGRVWQRRVQSRCIQWLFKKDASRSSSSSTCSHGRRLVLDLRETCRRYSSLNYFSCSSLLQEAPYLYCSPDCRYHAASTSTLLDQDDDNFMFHPVVDTSRCRWLDNDFAGISAWAAEVPYGLPADLSTSYTTSFSHSLFRPPELLSFHPRITPPALCTDTLQATPPAPLHPRHPTMQPPDVSRISLKSALTESSLATPASSHPMPISTIKPSLGLDGIYSNVRSWVTPSPTSPPRVKPFKLTPSALNTRLRPVSVVSPSDTSPHGFPDEDAPHWKFSTIIVDQPPKHAPEHRQPRECRLPHELLRMADQNSSLRARGRKASRAVA